MGLANLHGGVRVVIEATIVYVETNHERTLNINKNSIDKNMNTHIEIIRPHLFWDCAIPGNALRCLEQTNPNLQLTSIASLMLFLMSRIFCFFSLWRSEVVSRYFTEITVENTVMRC